jgi:hypothetical protein
MSNGEKKSEQFRLSLRHTVGGSYLSVYTVVVAVALPVAVASTAASTTAAAWREAEVERIG